MAWLTRRWLVLVLLAMAATLTVVGCRRAADAEVSGETSSAISSDPVAPARQVITEEMLPPMLLTAEEVVRLFPSARSVFDRSKVVNNQEAIAATLDPTDTGDDFGQAGRLSGYRNPFYDSEAALALFNHVDLFDSSESAAAFMALVLNDRNRYAGRRVEEGVFLKEYEQIPRPGLGNGGEGRREAFDFYDTQIYNTSAMWRRDNIVAVVGISGRDEMDWWHMVTFLATMMNNRIDRVLAGEIQAPSHRADPEVDSAVYKMAALDAGYDLEAMLLTSRDLQNVSVATEVSYYQSPDAVASLQQVIRSSGFSSRFRDSLVEQIVVGLALTKSSLEAAEALEGIRGIPEQYLEEAWLDYIEAQAGYTPDPFSVKVVKAKDLQNSHGYIFHEGVAWGDYDWHRLYFVVGRVSAVVNVVGPAGRVKLEDTMWLARLVEKRIVKHSPH